MAQLASSIAHQINNPLAGLTNLLYLAHQRAEIPEVREYLQVAEEELRRVCSITQQSLRLHKQQVAPQSACPAKMVSDVVAVFQSRLSNAAIRVEERHRTQNPVLCLLSDVGQMLSELVDNALAAMGGGGTLRLRTREATDWRTGAHGTVLTVSDNGTGIDAKSLARILEPFYTTKGIGGVGLGLWIAADIVKRHTGRLQVRSSGSGANHGTTVVVFLPQRVVATDHLDVFPAL